MDIQILILDFILSERTGILLLLYVFFITCIPKTRSSKIEGELRGLKDRVNQLVTEQVMLLGS